jgi:hypothetical protein
MSQGKPYSRDPDGVRFKPGSINTVKAPDQLADTEWTYLQNVRGYLQDRITGRAAMGDPVLVATSSGFQTLTTGTGTNSGGPSGAWTNPANITASGSSYATGSVTFTTSSTQTLLTQNIGFSIPSDATVTGIQISFVTNSTLGPGITILVRALQNGVFAGTQQVISVGPGVNQCVAGGQGNLFGATWTPTDINGATGLGAGFIASTRPPFGQKYQFGLNSLSVTVYYNVPGPLTGMSVPIHSIRRLNDSTPSGPGYEVIVGGAGNLYANGTRVASGLSGNPLSLVPFRPNASVGPWMYVGDSSQIVNLISPAYSCAGMVKVRSDGLTYKTGIKEPQIAPLVSTANAITSGVDTLLATTYPWLNSGGANPAYNYGQTTGTAPVIISTPVYGSTVRIAVTGTATLINGFASVAPSLVQANSGSYAGFYIYPGSVGFSSLVVGTFTDSSGNVIAGTATAHNPVDVGAGGTFTVPSGATQFQVGINSAGAFFGANSGQFSLEWQVTTSAFAQQLSTAGSVTAYNWGDSPHSGPVSAYRWKSPGDVGTGTPRSIATAQAVTENDSWEFDSTPQDGTIPVDWNVVDSSGSVTGTLPLFPTSLEPPNYPNQDFNNFNSCIIGSLFVPAAGSYAFSLQYKDQIMFGIGGGAQMTGNVTTTSSWHAPVTQTGPFTGINGQTKTVASDLPLMFVGLNNSGTGSNTFVVSAFTVKFPAGGTYQVEIDWDYWQHTGRCLYMKAALVGQTPVTIPTLPTGVRTNVSYAYKYRSSKTGAVSNPSPLSPLQVTPVLDNTLSSVWSSDPQVDLVDYYRQDSGLSDYVYVATGPNDGLGGTVGPTLYNTAITDTLTDAAALANAVMQLDDFEPFPSIDLPRQGVINVTGGVLSWVSGDRFNTRWLAGTLILIGNPTQLAYTLVARPTSVTSMTIPGVPDGTSLAYNIAEPILAAQPLPSLWGPTDNTAYMFGCGDPLRPGTLYFTKGNNPDSAPDTNQIEVTSPSEPLMNGCIVNGIGMVFSSERGWLIYPTFATALATVSGVEGQVFNLVESIANRGLYIRSCICTEAGKNVFFRGKDGIYVSEGGAGSASITDSQIYNLFPHEGVVPQPVVISAFTIYPPDDTQPDAQKLSFANGYLYYDYLSTLNTPCTLVFDVAAKGWSVDIYSPTVTEHALEEGEDSNDTLVGAADGSVRRLSGTGTEATTSIIATRCINAGDARARKTLGDIFIRALVANSSTVTVKTWQDRFATLVSATGSLVGNGVLTDYIVDIPAGTGEILTDVEGTLSWTTGNQSIFELWQPDFTPLPETIQDQPSDWDDAGVPGNKFVQGLLLECNTLGVSKQFSIQRSDDSALFVPVEVPFSQNGQSIRTFTFNPPFTAHMLRRVATDGVPWMAGPSGGWTLAWIVEPYPEASTAWITEASAFGLQGWIHCYQINLAYIAAQQVTLTATTDQGTFALTFPAAGSGLQPAKILLKAPRNKWKVCSFSVTSSQPFYLWKNLIEVWLKPWGSTGEYLKINPFGSVTALEGAAI